MSIAITCGCGKRFKVEDELANQQVQCQCGNIFTVPEKPHIPWKKYYGLGWQRLKNKLRIFSGPNPELLKEELICYWGFLIAREAEDVGLEHFSAIEPVYLSWKKVQEDLLGEQNQKKFHKLAGATYRLSREIGGYCWEKGYRFQKFSDIVRIEEPLAFLESSDKNRKMTDSFWQQASRALPWFLRFSTLFNTAVILSVTLLVYCLWISVPSNIFSVVVGATAAVCVFLPLFFRGRHAHSEKKRLKQVWIDSLAQSGEDFISPEIVEEWIDAIFDKRWKNWKYVPSQEIVIPDDLTAGFIPDVMFSGDTITEFGIEFDQEVESWCQDLYRFCRDSFSERGEINLCFFYAENQSRIEKFLQRMYHVVGELNETKGEEIIWVGQHNCTTPRRLGTFLSLMAPMFQRENFPADRHWKMSCELFEFIALSMQIFDYHQISSKNKSQLKTPSFLEIFEGLRGCLYMLAKRRPVVLVIENLDHSDPLSLDFICNLTQGDRAHRLCFLVSYDRESVLRMPPLKKTILLLQKQNCWKTPEKQLEKHVLSQCFIGKTNLWQSLEDGFNRCTGTPVLQITGIHGESGMGKTFLGRQFLEVCSQQEDRYRTIYHDHGAEPWEGLNSLAFLQKVLKTCKEEDSKLQQELRERVSLLYDFLHFDEQNAQKTRSFRWKKSEDRTLVEMLDDFDHSALSEREIAEKRRYNLQREIADILSQLACQKTMVLFLDNLHNADSSTLELLYYLLGEPIEAPIFIIFSWDTAAIGKSNANFRNFIEGIRERQCFQQLDIDQPNAEEVANYIAQEWKPNLLAESANSPFVQKIMELSGGNTLLIVEYLKLLLSTGSLYQFGGFWILKEENAIPSLEFEKMARQFINSFPQEDHKLLIAILHKASVYGEVAPIKYLEYGMQELGWTPDDVQAAVERMLTNSILLKASRRGCFEFVHPQYRKALYGSLPAEQKKELHWQVLEYIDTSDHNELTLLLAHAEAAKSWEKVLEHSEKLGRHNLNILELNTASAIFDRGILAAQHLEEIPSLSKYYLLKSLTFPSRKPQVNIESYKSLLAKKEWKAAAELSMEFPDPTRACEEFLGVVQRLRIDREDFTALARQLLDMFMRVRSEYVRSSFMNELIPMFSKADPLQLRSLVEHSLNVVKDIYNVNMQSELYLLLQGQLGEMDLDLIRIVSNRISPLRCSLEKSKSICYLATFLPKNPDMMGELIEEANEVANRVYRIMACRGILQHLLSCAPDQAPYIFDKIIQFIGEISVHSRRMEALNAFLTGIHGEIEQRNFSELIASLPDGYRLQILRSLLSIIQQTLDVPLRLVCLKKLAANLSLITQAEGYKEFIEEFIEELKNLKKAGERGEGLLEIANAILEDNMNLAHQYLEEGLDEIENMHSLDALLLETPDTEKVIAILQKILALLQKLPQPIVYPLWDRAIKIAESMESEKQDPLYSNMVISLFPYDQEKAMQLALQIRTAQYRHQTIENLLALPGKSLSIETLEKAILEHARESYGHVLLQQMAEKDSGRARRLLRELPDTLETQIASVRLCKASGQRIREILNLSKGTVSNEEILSQISMSLEILLKRKEYDPLGNEMLLESIPDCYLGKITLLMALVYATQEVDPPLACEALVRVPALVEKHRIESGKSPALKKIMSEVDKILQELQPAFIETYIEKILPAVEMISAGPMRNLFIKSLCEKLKTISPDIVLEIVEKTEDSKLRFQLLQSIDKEIVKLQSSPSEFLEYLEPLTALGMIEQVYPALGQPVRQIIRENIVSCGDETRKIELWTQTLKAGGNWDEDFNDFAFAGILQEAGRVPQEEITPYIDILHVLQGFPGPLKNRFLSRLIEYMTDHNGHSVPTSLCSGRHSFWNALRFLDALIPFGNSHMHSFVMKLLTIPKSNANFTQTIECINEFLFLCRGAAPEKECEWIAEAINYLDTASHESDNAVVQEDYYLLRALNMVHLSRSLVVYEPAKALRAAQRALQLTEYSVHRQRLHRYILLLLSSIIDVVQAEVKEKAPDLFRPIEIMRFQWAYHHLQALKGHTPEDRKKFLQEEKNIAKELLHYLLGYLGGTASTPDKTEMEDLWSMAYQQFEKEIEECFDKLSGAKEGPGLIQAFFILAQALCLMDDESLSSWRRVPWFQRLVRMAARMDASKLREAGDDLLQPDEKEEFSLLVQRVSLVYPKSVLYLIRSMFSTEKISEISATLEEEAISDELLKEIIEPLKNISLSHYRDRLLTELALEWAEYNWGDGFLLVTSITDFEVQAATIYRLVRKSCDFYPKDVLKIGQRAFILLQKIKNCPNKIAALEEVALRLIKEDHSHVLSIVSAIEPRERQKEILKKIIATLDLEQSYSFVAQIVEPVLRAGCMHNILCKLPEDVETRCAYLGKLWEMARKIHEDELRVELIKQIVRTGIREKELLERPQEIANILLEMWENASRIDNKPAFQIISATFPAFIKLLEKTEIRDLFQVLYQPEYLPISKSHGLYKTMIL